MSVVDINLKLAAAPGPTTWRVRIWWRDDLGAWDAGATVALSDSSWFNVLGEVAGQLGVPIASLTKIEIERVAEPATT